MPERRIRYWRNQHHEVTEAEHLTGRPVESVARDDWESEEMSEREWLRVHDPDFYAREESDEGP